MHKDEFDNTINFRTVPKVDNKLMSRPTIDQYFIAMVKVASTRGACVRRKTGCILVNERDQFMSSGYNGRPAGMINCIDSPCAGADLPSGTGLDQCEAVHAEANALLQCNDIYGIKTAYCTTAPCIHCVKLLLNTSCKRIVFIDDYPHDRSKELWLEAGRIWEKYSG